MPSLIPSNEYDIFVSYRQNDNRTGWVTEFVKNLQEELAATIKEPVSVYFDSNPHDGLLETRSDPEQDYFSDGITEEILNALSQIRKLKVTGRTSSFQFKGKNPDLRKVGDKLKVRSILEGSVKGPETSCV